MMSSDTSVTNNNRYETHKLYLTLLPFSMYANPFKQYSRKIKLKRPPPQSAQSAQSAHSHNVSGSSTNELIIVPSYLTAASISAAVTPSIPVTRNIEAAVKLKARKKMKLTSDSSTTLLDDDDNTPESPKQMIEEEPANNIIIFKPGEHEKMKHVKYSLADLRTLCSHYCIKKSGTKPELTQRIYTFLNQSYHIVRIQRIFRSFISRKYRALCGPGYLNTTNCVNDSDFYTFDKLSKIRPLELFTYRDSDNKIYGFHIASIFHLIITSYPNITNPYNRNVIPSSIINNVYEKLIYGTLLGFRVSVKLDDDDNGGDGGDGDDDGNGGNGGNGSNGGGGSNSGYIAAGGGRGDTVGGGLSREKQEELFIVDLFQHINTLGNYSDSEWFIALQRAELIRFIRNVHDIWFYRANLSQEMKERICPPNGNPFVLHNAHVNLNVLTLLTDPEIRTICVSIIERMVRRGVSREDQCLGAFYVLATLTIVNQDARNAMPWLYEAVL